MGEQQLARLGGHGAPAVSGEQGLVQFHFQQSHLTAQRGLRDVQRNGGAGEAAEFGNTHKVFELLEIHSCLGE